MNLKNHPKTLIFSDSCYPIKTCVSLQTFDLCLGFGNVQLIDCYLQLNFSGCWLTEDFSYFSCIWRLQGERESTENETQNVQASIP